MKTPRLGLLLCLLLWNAFVTIAEKKDIVWRESSNNKTDSSGLKVALSITLTNGTEIDIYCPKYFLMLENEATYSELDYYMQYGVWSQRVLLENLFVSLEFGKDIHGPEDFQDFLDRIIDMDIDFRQRDSDYCSWSGITCDEDKDIYGIYLDDMDFEGTLPEELKDLDTLVYLDLSNNEIHGTIPDSWKELELLRRLNLRNNQIEGTIPASFSELTEVEHLVLGNNKLEGSIPASLFDNWDYLEYFDISRNNINGTIPKTLMKDKTMLATVKVRENMLTGTLPNKFVGRSNMPYHLDFSSNQLTGTIPAPYMTLPQLNVLDLSNNKLSGTIPSEIVELERVSQIILNDNQLTGQLPSGEESGYGKRVKAPGGKWTNLQYLKVFKVDNNKLTGTLPAQFFEGAGGQLEILDIASNNFTGSLPKTVGRLVKLKEFTAGYNGLTGTMPKEMKHMSNNCQLNFTANFLTGNIPKVFCGGGPKIAMTKYYRSLGCDIIMCPPGTFHPEGAATLDGGCRSCRSFRNEKEKKYLAQTSCHNLEHVHGDLDGDGILSEREILRLFYVYTIGHNWGAKYEDWGDPFNDPCNLYGIECVNNHVAKIDVSDASICTNGERKAHRPIEDCRGIPSELALLTNLEVLIIKQRQYLRGTLPTELGTMSMLKHIDMANCVNMHGPIPSEIGNLSNLQFLNLGGCRFNGAIPEEIYDLTKLERLNLNKNHVSGRLPPKIQNLKKIKELMISRTFLSGTLPEELGTLANIENIEVYGNKLTGSIPSSLGNCTHLRRIDLFNNKLNGTIPDSMSTLQSLHIFHTKMNNLSGTISPNFGSLPFLHWFDVSANNLHGTIPATFGSSLSMKQFRLGGNMIYEPIPPSLCTNTYINDGMASTFGCDGVLCPLGTYSESGHATNTEECKPCPEGQTTLYLGSSSCKTITEKDILSMFFYVMGGEHWNSEQQKNWNDDSSSVCEWHGIGCDEEGEISSIQFPMSVIDEQDLLENQ